VGYAIQIASLLVSAATLAAIAWKGGALAQQVGEHGARLDKHEGLHGELFDGIKEARHAAREAAHRVELLAERTRRITPDHTGGHEAQ